jgi:uncharacterized coiled-coil protein SlyX
MTDAERLTRLEERYAHLQRHVTAQDKAVLEIGDELARLRQELAALRAQQRPAPGGDDSAGEGRPPHY